MRAALADAALAPEAIELVNAHGTSTPLNDATETRALHEVFGAHAARLAVHATKSMTGHALGASAAIEAVASVLTLRRGIIHPTINLDHPDPACDLDYVPHRARERRVSTVMSNSFGFGGHNAVLIFRALDG
jgi:3-oxoacyl-[acyl-carrier-protein] synthase II